MTKQMKNLTFWIWKTSSNRNASWKKLNGYEKQIYGEDRSWRKFWIIVNKKTVHNNFAIQKTRKQIKENLPRTSNMVRPKLRSKVIEFTWRQWCAVLKEACFALEFYRQERRGRLSMRILAPQWVEWRSWSTSKPACCGEWRRHSPPPMRQQTSAAMADRGVWGVPRFQRIQWML